MLSINSAKKFKALSIKLPKGMLMYGPHICVADQCMLPEARGTATHKDVYRVKMMPDTFELTKKSPVIIFIDELNTIGTTNKSGDHEVQRTMLELLNQPDDFKFSNNECIKVIAATSRINILNLALLRSGYLDRKIKLALSDECVRRHILEIHSRKMRVHGDVKINFEKLARSTDEFNVTQLRQSA